MPWSPEAYYVGKVPVILMKSRQDILKEAYRLEKHVEGGFFSEIYSAPFAADGRSFAGSIYFLLSDGEVSHFHEIDCDEIWYYHEGCGMKVTVLADGRKEEFLLGKNVLKGEQAMVLIPKGSIFAAENLEGGGFTFVSCATVPHFEYAGFRLVYQEEIREKYPDLYHEVRHLIPERQSGSGGP